MKRILIIDHNDQSREYLTEVLLKRGFFPFEAHSFKRAMELFREEDFSTVLLELVMPDKDGISIMKELKKLKPEIPFIFMAEATDVSTAVDTVKQGAYDFVTRPPKMDHLIFTLDRAIEKLELNQQIKRLNTTVETSLERLLGPSEHIKKVIDQIYQVAWSNFSVLIQGETGTGKSFIANTIHNMSSRAKGPFVKVDIGAIPETLVESELFGHEKGAFTGASKSKKGFFEHADGGTIFIDELENMSLYVQSKILSVVETKELYPLGSPKPVKVDVRIIAATNTDIKESVVEKQFREDLFFRLCEFMIYLPPLRNRPDDVLFLAQKFLLQTKEELDKPMAVIPDETTQILRNYRWPGNVRELKNVIRRATLFSDDGIIYPQHVDFLNQENITTEVVKEVIHTDHNPVTVLPLKELTAVAIRDVEEKAIKQALIVTGGNKTKAASLLKISPRSFFAKVKEYGIS